MSKPTTALKSETLPVVPVVGIGASAGGLEAFSSLLKALPRDTGMAFVIITHLLPEKKSVLGEILGKTTLMPVIQLEEKTLVEANHIYVIPPDKELWIEDGYLQVASLSTTDRPSYVIDRFFRSLAEHRKSKAVGIILSGTGSDGTRGLADIKMEGGITFVQDPRSAAFDDMPRSATPSADYVLKPEQIAAELQRLANHPYVAKEPAIDASNLQRGGELKQIFHLIQAAGGVDLNNYKPSSIRRRVARRMILRGVKSLRDYLALLQVNKQEVDELYQDVLITFTEFFRDPEVFDALRNDTVPRILSALPNDVPARAWIAGCASGEEAYSIAICFVEASKDRMGPPVQIFATDVSDQCINRARRAVYPEHIATNVSAERLRHFFVKAENGYKVTKFIRDLCIFARQDVIDDPPFSKIDLVSCRNVLIYMDSATQKRVLQQFHYALKPTGFLLLGTSESVASAPDLFDKGHPTEHIYTKAAVSSRVDFAPAHTADFPGASKTRREAERPFMDVRKEVDQILLRRFAPAGVVLNSALNILEFRGSIHSLIEPKTGTASLNIFSIIRKELIFELHAALDEARTGSGPVRGGPVEIDNHGVKTKVGLEIVRFRAGPAGAPYFLVLFDQFKADVSAAIRERKDSSLATRHRQPTLRDRLITTQVHLRSVAEEQERTKQALQSATEEALVSNEELQSINEEMQTGREELQATNEELHSINDELKKHNLDLTEAYTDVRNLVESLEIASVLIDNNLRIRQFTPAAHKLLNIIPSDVGRSIADITPNINMPNLPNTLAEVIKNLTPVEREVQDSEGHWYLLRIRPYKTPAAKIEGAVMYLVDVDNVKHATSSYPAEKQDTFTAGYVLKRE